MGKRLYNIIGDRVLSTLLETAVVVGAEPPLTRLALPSGGLEPAAVLGTGRCQPAQGSTGHDAIAGRLPAQNGRHTFPSAYGPKPFSAWS